MRAGYSERSAYSEGQRLLKNDEVAKAISDGAQKLHHKTEITAERVLAEMAKLAFGDTRKLFDAAGRLKPVHEWDDETAGAIGSLEVVTKSLGEGEVEYVAKVKQWDKGKALEMLGRHLSLFNDKLEITGSLAERIAEARRRERTRKD